MQEHLVPGAVAGVVTRDGRTRIRAYGHAQIEPEVVPLNEKMYFDLASLTKVFLTLRAVLRHAEEVRLDLDSSAYNWLPEVLNVPGKPLGTASLRSLLTHQAGLPASPRTHDWPGPASARLKRVPTEPWPLGPNVYSDTGYILLGLVVERIEGSRLAHLTLDEGFSFAPPAEATVATERCALRGRMLRGEVHDENAFALGGVAGHAGLFGTIHGVLNTLLGILRQTWLSPAALEEMLRPASPTRALGWERKHPGWSGGSLASPAAIGHTGFTGTGCWIDPVRGVGWALLTNDVHPLRGDAAPIINLRRFFGNAVAATHSRAAGEL
ncbi:serine hydrolase domain-containing protein [soil metagenome]